MLHAACSHYKNLLSNYHFKFLKAFPNDLPP